MSELLPHEEEEQLLGQEAYRLQSIIVEQVKAVQVAWWSLAEQLHQFNELKGWRYVGLETLGDFLAQPEVTLSRAQYYRLVRVWEDLVVIKQVDPSRLSNIEPSKVHEVTPAIMRGQVSVEEGLDQAEATGARDLREMYRPKIEPEPQEEDEEPEEYQLPDIGDEVCTLTNAQVATLCFESVLVGRQADSDNEVHGRVAYLLGERGIDLAQIEAYREADRWNQ